MHQLSNKVFYVGSFLYPDRNAGAHRVHTIGKCLATAGFDVSFIGYESTGRSQDLANNNGYIYDGFYYYPSELVGQNIFRRFWRGFYGHMTGLCTMRRLKSLCTTSTVAVIAYQASSFLLAQLRRFCTKHNIIFIVDTVEWYDRGHVQGGRYGVAALDSEIRMRKMQCLADGAITISKFLESYYNRRNILTLRVPPLIDINNGKWCTETSSLFVGSKLRISFVGNAGKKDLLTNAIRGLSLLREKARECQLIVVGPSQVEVRANLGPEAGLLEKFDSSLHFATRVPHHEALKFLAQSDFSLVLRPDARFAHAGFSTKLVESLAMGVPVICNLTSDIGMYIHDGQEGIILKDCSPT